MHYPSEGFGLHLALAATVTALFMAPSQACAQAEDVRPTIAVMHFGNGAIGPAHAELEPLTRGIPDLLIGELAANPGVRIVERDNLQKLIDEQNLSASERVGSESAVRLGRILGVHHMIVGAFVTDSRGTMRLTARSVNVETSEIEHIESVQGKQDNMMSLITELSMKLNRGLKLPDLPRQIRDSREQTAKKVPFQAAMLYSRALAAKDSGDRQQAVMLLTRALEQFPQYEPALREREKLTSGSR
ncbi:MAG: CsgG/HfaB family protein [Gemmatimonadaceae bacterium]